VLTGQQAAKPAPDTAAPANPAITDKKDKASDQTDAAESTDEALAKLASEQGLSLPQIALNIAAEVALAVAARQPAAVRGAQAGTAAVAPTDAPALAGRDLPAVLADAAATATAADKTIIAKGPKDAAPATALPALDIPASANSKAIALPPGFVPAQAAALPQQAELGVRKAPVLTGAKQNQLAAQAQIRGADAGPGKAVPADFSALVVDAGIKPNIQATVVPADLSPAQAGSISAAGSAAASTTLLSGSMGSAANTGAQPALPGISTPLNSPQWGGDFGRQFVSLAQGGHNMPHTAELRLDPPELGPLRISINISDNVAHAIFASPHAAVRQTVENALPQLQQLLAQAGISLGQTSVNDQGQSGQAFNESFGSSRKSAITASAGVTGEADASLRPAARSRGSDALVDTFA
jgi:flagellar hook-length control protein FliK